MKISEKERKRRQHYKELKSLKNKMSGPNLIWFNSLSLRRQYDFLYDWKSEKHFNITKKLEISYVPLRGWGIIVPFKEYPPSLKHFIKKSQKRMKYRVHISKLRDTTISALLETKN